MQFINSKQILREITHNLFLGLESVFACFHGNPDRTQAQFLADSNEEVEAEPEFVGSNVETLEEDAFAQLVATGALALVEVQQLTFLLPLVFHLSHHH